MTVKSPKPLFDTLTELLANEQPGTTIAQPNLVDFQLIRNFLISYRGSVATFNAYRRELERFLHWCWANGKSLTTVKRDDVEQFIEFCKNPPKDWITTKQVPRFIIQNGQRVANPTWRPFNQGQQPEFHLSQKALQAIFSILSSFYTYLLQEQTVEYNPVAQVRQKSKFIRKQQQQQVRRLSELQWSYVIETAKLMAEESPANHERSLMMISMLYGMYLRISELVASENWIPQMGDFRRDQDGNWWFTTVGKGNKQRQIAVSNEMLSSLKRYRQYLGLPPIPKPGESRPIFMKHRGNGAITSTRQVRDIVQLCFDRAQQRLQADGFNEEAIALQDVTVHWLRHTGISEDVKTRPREHVRDDAGHSSSAITDQYIDIELRARHASSKNKKINPD